ncbi:MAG: hypothetical protein ACKO96_35330, partial [Flammeovirgaceae bacterium]
LMILSIYFHHHFSINISEQIGNRILNFLSIDVYPSFLTIWIGPISNRLLVHITTAVPLLLSAGGNYSKAQTPIILPIVFDFEGDG